MTLTIHDDLAQGSDEWLAARRGIVTASVVGKLLTSRPATGLAYPCPECLALPDDPCVSLAKRDGGPIKTLHGSRVAPPEAPPTIDAADNDTSRALTLLLVAERITGWTDPVFVSADMMRGTWDEPIARDAYAAAFAPVTETGLMVCDDWGYSIGYSPDGLVGDDGLIEVKSRRQKKHLQTILADTVPAENMAQIQCGLLVSGRAWCDYVSFCGGMPLWVKRVHPDHGWFDAITQAVGSFEQTAAHMAATYHRAVDGMPATERTNYDQEIEF